MTLTVQDPNKPNNFTGSVNTTNNNTINGGVGYVDPGTLGGVQDNSTNEPLYVTPNTGMQSGSNVGIPSSPSASAQYGAQEPAVQTTYQQPLYTAPDGTPYYDAAAAQAAQDLARANELKGSLSTLINQIRGVYNSIYGDIGTVGADKASAVNRRFGNETRQLTDQFNTEFPTIGNAYSARNAYDSSYRYDAEQGAIKNYGNLVDQLATGRDEDLAQVGEFVATGQATINADKAKLDTIIDRISKSTDPDELDALKAQYQNTLQDLIASRSGYRSQDSFRATANQLVKTNDRTASLKQSLSNIIAGAAPSVLKRQVGQQLITQSGLSAEEQSRLLAEFNSLLGGTTQSEQTVPVTG